MGLKEGGRFHWMVNGSKERTWVSMGWEKGWKEEWRRMSRKVLGLE